MVVIASPVLGINMIQVLIIKVNQKTGVSGLVSLRFRFNNSWVTTLDINILQHINLLSDSIIAGRIYLNVYLIIFKQFL